MSEVFNSINNRQQLDIEQVSSQFATLASMSMEVPSACIHVGDGYCCESAITWA